MPTPVPPEALTKYQQIRHAFGRPVYMQSRYGSEYHVIVTRFSLRKNSHGRHWVAADCWIRFLPLPGEGSPWESYVDLDMTDFTIREIE